MTPEELIGQSLRDGEYVLKEILGRGGMATVYRASSRSLATDVAVKVLAPRLARDPRFRERFHDEARSLAPMHHPNLIEVHHYGEEGDLVYIAMRLVEGGNLRELALAMEGPLDIDTTARVISQVADALQLAHESDLIHLDIKPENVLLGQHDWPLWPLLADFGITRAIQREETTGGRERVAGTPQYMSPEQCVGGPIDGRSDEYSLAATAFELLTGRMLFTARTPAELIQNHIATPPPRPRQVNPAIPGPVEEVVLRGLAKRPEDRYPTVREFGRALSAAAEQTRGVSQETRQAIIAIAPNLVGIAALLLVGPLLLTLVPDNALLGGRLPLAWPFQFILGLMLGSLLLGVRWQLIGLLSRLTSGAFETILAAGGWRSSAADASRTPGDSPATQWTKTWRNAVVGAVEGAVNLGYLLVLYQLLAVPTLTILATVVPVPIDQVMNLGVAIVVIVAAIANVVAIYRSSGPAVAALLLAASWAVVTALSATGLTVVGGGAAVETAKLLLGAVVLVAILAVRRSTRQVVAQAVVATLGPLLILAQPGATREQIAAGRNQVGRLAEGILDVGYLLLGYAVLQAPLVSTLRQPLGILPAAILVSGAAALVWAFLVLRLHWIAGTPGVALGVVLGAPLLTSLPALQPTTLGIDWPGAVATWVVAVAVVAMLALVHGQIRVVGQRAAGPLLDRGLAGTRAAPTEAQGIRRSRSLEELGGALVDVLLLVLAYWVVGLPAVGALNQASGRHDLGTIVLAAVVLAALGRLAGPLRRALIALDETGGSPRSRRFAALPGVAIAVAALLVGGCAAVPAVLAAPGPSGDLALVPPESPVVLVDWQHYVPWTPSQDLADYTVSLSCSDGRVLGVFQEAFRPPSGAAMPSGNVGTLGRTRVPCSDWANTYFGLRQAAGLPAQKSVSWDAVDVRAVLQQDGSVDVVETHRVLFTYGTHTNLTWQEAAGGNEGTPTGVEAAVDGVTYPSGPSGAGSPFFQVISQDGKQQIGWSFPPTASPVVRTFTVHYRLKGALQPIDGGQQFARRVLLADRAGPVWRTTVEFTLPDGPAQQLQLSSTGAPTRSGVIDGRTAWFEAVNVPVGNELGIIVKIPSSGGSSAATPPSPTSTPTPGPSPSPTGVPSVGAAPLAASPAATATPTETATSTPAVTAEPTLSATPTPTPGTMSADVVITPPTAAPSSSATSTATPLVTDTVTVTPTGTDTTTVTPTGTVTMTVTPTGTATLTATPTVTSTRTLSPTPTSTWTATPTNTATSTPLPTNTATPVPAMSIRPASGAPQITVAVGGANFGGSLPIAFTIDGASLTSLGSRSSCTSTSSGTFSCGFPYPLMPAGGHVVAGSDGTRSASTNFTVVPGNLVLNPNSGGPGTVFTVTDSGFAPSSSITITLGGTPLAACSSKANGTFSCTETVPCVSSPGSLAVVATDGAKNSATASFSSTACLR